MRKLIAAVLFATLALNVSACANKGKLKTPTQIQAEEDKKAREDAKKAKGESVEQPLLPPFTPKAEPQ